jgi:hypothetical protein
MSAMGMGNGEWGIAAASDVHDSPHAKASAFFAVTNPESPLPIPGFSAVQRRKS